MSIARDISRQTSIQTATLTASQTSVTVTGGFSGSSIDVYLNGARIVQGQDYSLNGTSGIILSQGASAGDIIEFVIRNTSNSGFSAADTGQIVDGAVTFDKLSDSATESSNVQKRVAKAWLSYIGTTQTIESDFNISSVSWNSAGDYTINFENSMNNGNYAFATHGADTNNNTTIHTWGQGQNFSKSATSIRLQHYLNGGGGYDSYFGVCVIIFGD
jgi:hypothetical protein